MQHLVAYVEGHVDELVDDLLPALREADPVFRECDARHLREGLRAALLHFDHYFAHRAPQSVEASLEALRALWGPERFLQSIPIRVLFQFEDLVAIRAQHLYADLEEFIDALRALHAAAREALCQMADLLQARHGVWEADRRTMPISGGDAPGGQATHDDMPVVSPQETPAAGEIEGRMVRADPGRGPLLDLLDSVHPVGRADELRQVWARLRAVASALEDEPPAGGDPRADERRVALAARRAHLCRAAGRQWGVFGGLMGVELLIAQCPYGLFGG